MLALYGTLGDQLFSFGPDFFDYQHGLLLDTFNLYLALIAEKTNKMKIKGCDQVTPECVCGMETVPGHVWRCTTAPDNFCCVALYFLFNSLHYQ